MTTSESEQMTASQQPPEHGTAEAEATASQETSLATAQDPERPAASQQAHVPTARSKLSSLTTADLVKYVLIAAAVVLLGVLYLAQARVEAATSEGAGQALQGWDMLHGNLLLRGWSMSDVSFYTTEVPEYALIELVRGLNAGVVPMAGAFSYFLQVLLAGWLARGKATGREGWVRVLVAVGIMIAPVLGKTTGLLMAAPDHAGSQVPVLLIYLVIDRVRQRWWVPVLVTALLAWAQIADAIVFFEAALPVAAVYAMRMYRRRGPAAAQWYDLSMVVGAAISLVIAKEIQKAILHAGGFYIRPLMAAFASPSQISGHIWTQVRDFLLVFSANFLGTPLGGHTVISMLHMVGIGLVIWAVVHVIRRIYVFDDPVAQMLVVGFVVVLVGFMVGIKTDDNEIVGLLPIGAVLAGRVLGDKILRNGFVPALSVVLACMVGFLISNASQPAGVSPSRHVASWLRAHHLTYGLAGFWNANIITLETGGRVQVRPVRTYLDQVVRTNLENNASWYDPQLHYANFLLWKRGPCGDLCLTSAGVSASFGPPAATYRVGHYLVLVYHENLLQNLPVVSFCAPGWSWRTINGATNKPHC